MRPFKIGVVLLILAQAACTSLSGTVTPVPGVEAVIETLAPTVIPSQAAITETLAPTATVSPAPSPTRELSVLDLEVLEWAVYPDTRLADPQNTDPRLEILVRNLNEFPVVVNTDNVEIRLLSAAGETVYTNANPIFYIWQRSWIQAGETVPLSVCICFETDGVEKQAWETIEVVAPLAAATDIAYTTDVAVTAGEFFALPDPLLGGDVLGAEIELLNTSDQILRSFEVRVLARDAGGKYVGVAVYSSLVEQSVPGDITPGASVGGIIVSQIDYVDGPLAYEVTAIGIPAR